MSGTVGQMGAPPAAASTTQPDPVLFEDIDPILLAKVYPGGGDTKAQAMAAGEAAKAAGAELVASQQQEQAPAAETPPPA